MAGGSQRLPVPWEELPDLLSRDLDAAHPRNLRVRSAMPGEVPFTQLVLVVEAGAESRRTETWRLTYDVPDGELQLLGLESFVLTVRANIEEWWDTRPAGPSHLRAVRVR